MVEETPCSTLEGMTSQSVETTLTRGLWILGLMSLALNLELVMSMVPSLKFIMMWRLRLRLGEMAGLIRLRPPIKSL